ncbi:MAG: macro domain-containing protein [Bacillota bacterium]|nr:macro domain-containing protein [Bacillota bacterium]
MPFKIIRNDITKVRADVIVNTANPKPIYASGTDLAVYQAAGADDLLAERKKIGYIERGDIAVTDAYALNAKYIIHTVGPVWVDGKHREFETLESCYEKSLQKALELGCDSIAFPLISTGVYGFPKDKALQIAVSVFSRFLLENDMQIILVVFDKKSFQLSGQLVGEIDSFIDANYIRQKRKSEYRGRPFRSNIIEADSPYDSELYEECRCYSTKEETEPDLLMSVPMPEKAMSLEEELENIGMSFHDKLFELIDKSGLDNKDVWKRANLDRKHFSKIQCDENYHPKKKTVMALCIALRLDLEEAKDLLARADWAFSPSSKVDLIVQKAIIDKQYDIYQLNLVLFQYTNEILGM